jgi:hypothetical protein
MESESSRRKRLNLQKYLILIVAVLIATAAIISTVNSVQGQGPIQIPYPGPNFEIDGNTSQDITAPPPGDDWETVIPGPGYLGVSGYLIKDPSSQAKSGETDYNTFVSGGEFGDLSTWTISDGNVPAQSELTNIYIYALLPSESEDGHSWMVMGMERCKKQGTFALDFELNKVPWESYTETPVRTPGDISIGFELSGNPAGPEDLEVLIVKYDPDDFALGCPTAPYTGTYGEGWCTIVSGNATAVGPYGAVIMNDGPIDAPPWGSQDSQGSPRDTIGIYQFAEAAIDLTALGIDPGCPGFGSVHAKSRASLSLTADLKDLSGPLALPVTCEIFGNKFEDLNSNGVWDAGEPGLEGWPIELYDNGSLYANTTTNASGYYHFGQLNDGVYRIIEVCPEGWSQTAPSPTNGCGSGEHSGIPIDIDNNSQGPYDFGNFRNVDVKACKYEDMDGDGGKDTAIEDWEVHLTINGTIVDTKLTEEDGCYTWENLGPLPAGGYYDISETVDTVEWTPTSPTSYDFEIPPQSGASYSGDFTNFRNVDVKACKLDDADGDLATTDDQTPIPVWPVALSIDGVIVEWQVTGPEVGGKSCYTWENLGPGHSYDVHEDVLAGWTALTLTSHDFGPAQSGEIYEFAFVNHEPPGGCPRTPGYWKNWNACSKEAQGMESPQFSKTIEKRLVGERLCEDGFCLVEDLLDPPLEIGNMDPLGLPDGWEPADGCTYNVSVIVSLLNMRDIDGIPKGKVMAKDPAFKLARNLIAAELNYRAGACTTPDVTQAMNDAYALLATIGFEGDGGYDIQWSKKKEPVLWMQAQQLASYLDRYNNAEFCGGDCP